MWTRKRRHPDEDNMMQINDQFWQTALKRPHLSTDKLSEKENIEIMNESLIDVGMEVEELMPSDKHTVYKIGNVLSPAAHEQAENICSIQNNPFTKSYNNNNNYSHNNQHMTPTDVCLRCQAGESGHFGHIGR